MKELLGWFFGVVLFILAISWILTGNDFFLYKFFAPKTESVRREVFEQSKAYNQGMVQELQNMQFEYLRATTDQRMALGSVILHRSADYDESKLPSDLRNFIQQLKKENI